MITLEDILLHFTRKTLEAADEVERIISTALTARDISERAWSGDAADTFREKLGEATQLLARSRDALYDARVAFSGLLPPVGSGESAIEV